MKNSFCRICRGRFNLKYPPIAVDSKTKKPSSRSIAVRIDESGEISDNICWDCEDTLLGFHKSVGEDNIDDEEPVIVDDDEILYKSLEKTRRRSHCVPKEIEIIEINSSDSEHEERVTVPHVDGIVKVESASTVVGRPRVSGDGAAACGNKNISEKKSPPSEMSSAEGNKKDVYTRGKVFESMRCPLCPYLSGIEYEVVSHIRHSHPQYTGDHIRFEHREGDSELTRRIIFVHLWTFFECKVCGRIHDRFWPHRKHLKTHNRKAIADTLGDHTNHNNNKVYPLQSFPTEENQCLKRALDSVDETNSAKKPRIDERVLRRTSKDNSSVESNEKSPVSRSRSKSPIAAKKLKKPRSVSKKSKSKGLLRKQQKLQAKREKRRQNRLEVTKSKTSKSKPLHVIPKPTFKMPQQPARVIPKPTFKMPQQPAPRAASIVKQLLQRPRFTCKLCSLTLTGFIAFNMHMLRVHPTEEFKSIFDLSDSGVCKRCDKTFSSASNLIAHFRLSHRRKNRHVEINGNDNEEICRQTLTPRKEPKENCILPQPKNGIAIPLQLSTPTGRLPTSALLCQYCGLLFATIPDKDNHESNHTSRAEVKRIFPLKPQS